MTGLVQQQSYTNLQIPIQNTLKRTIRAVGFENLYRNNYLYNNSEPDMSAYLQRFARAFAELDASHLAELDTLYSADIKFQDPLHRIEGLPALRNYFAQMYANVDQVRYDFHGFDEVGPGEGYLRWTLHYSHPRLAGGALISLQGCSYLRWNERVYLHQDFFDAGALLYEHLPLFGSVIGWLKRRLA